VLPKFRELNVGVDPGAEPKGEGELKAEAVVPPKMDGEVLEPNAVLLGAPNPEGVEVAELKGFDWEEPNVEPKGDGEDEEPKPDEPKVGVFGAKGFAAAVEEKGFAAV